MALVSTLSTETAWFCIRAQPKRERAAQQALFTLPDVEVMLPMAQFPKQNAKGQRQVREAIFPGYLFCRFEPATAARPVQYTQGVSYIIRRGEELVSISDDVITEIRTVAPEGVLELSPRPLFQGESIRLIQGIFAGSTAEVVELAPAADRVKVLLEILGREQEISVPVNAVERNFENPFRSD